LSRTGIAATWLGLALLGGCSTATATQRPAGVSVPASEDPPPRREGDREQPVARHRPNAVREVPVRRRTSLGFQGALFSGGGGLATTRSPSSSQPSTLRAGSGLLLGAAGRLTPIWTTGGYGLGLGLDLGVKFNGSGQGTGRATFRRFPIGLAGHWLMPVTGRVFFLVRAGLFKELGLRLGGSAVSSSWNDELSSGLGKQFDVGFSLPAGSVAFGVAARYCLLRYSFRGDEVSGNGLGIVLSLHPSI
jgi:hypothetical protein